MRTRIKVCGITRPEDGLAAARAGVDAVGLVFHPPSARCVTPAQAADIVAALPPFVTAVALFLDPAPEAIEDVLAQVPVGALQFHGGEDPALCARWGVPYLKAVPMGAQTDVAAYAGRYPDAAGLLLDSHREGAAGGSGAAFDWAAVPALDRPVILAGGLNSDNVGEAIEHIRPYAVDVSSGVETAKGIKSPTKIDAFVRSVQRVDADQHTPAGVGLL